MKLIKDQASNFRLQPTTAHNSLHTTEYVRITAVIFHVSVCEILLETVGKF